LKEIVLTSKGFSYDKRNLNNVTHNEMILVENGIQMSDFIKKTIFPVNPLSLKGRQGFSNKFSGIFKGGHQ